MKMITLYKSLLMMMVITLTACSEPYDFSGRYSLAESYTCKSITEEVFLTITATGAENTYQARLSPSLARLKIPTESKDATASEDDSLNFMFIEPGKKGVFFGKAMIEMEMKIVPRDDEHLYIQDWPSKMTHLMTGKGVSYNLIKDEHFKMLNGRSAPNGLYHLVGKKGVCLKKMNL